MNPLAIRDDLLAQGVKTREARETAGRALAVLRQEIHQTEAAERQAYQDAARGKGRPAPATVAARLRELREQEPAAADAYEGAEKAARAVERELLTLYQQEPEAFAEEAEAATQAFVARRDELIGDLAGMLGELAALERAARALWRPLCDAHKVERPRPSAAWSMNSQLAELAGAVPRSRAFTPEGEEASAVEEPPLPDGPVWLLTEDGREFCETPGSEAYKHLMKNHGAVIVDGPEEVAA